MKNKTWEEVVAEVDAEVAREGGPTGSNLAENPWVPPGPTTLPDNISEEEKERRLKLAAEMHKIILSMK